MHHPRDMIAHTTAFVTPVVEHGLERSRSGVMGVIRLPLIFVTGPLVVFTQKHISHSYTIVYKMCLVCTCVYLFNVSSCTHT